MTDDTVPLDTRLMQLEQTLKAHQAPEWMAPTVLAARLFCKQLKAENEHLHDTANQLAGKVAQLETQEACNRRLYEQATEMLATVEAERARWRSAFYQAAQIVDPNYGEVHGND